MTRRERIADSFPKWITPQVAAETLGVDDSTIHRMVKRGTIRGENLDGPGSPLRILASDFMRYLEGLLERMESKAKGKK
jgi:excisionase family DNA binding protein